MNYEIENYQERLLAIASERQDSEYPPTIFIGLGGTGQKSLLHLRRLFIERFETPVLNGTAFLAIDTDVYDQSFSLGGSISAPQIAFREQEQLHLNAPITNILENLSAYPQVQGWMSPNMKVVDYFDITCGSGQMRPIGRLVGVMNKERIGSHLAQAQAQVQNFDVADPRIVTHEPTNVYIIASLAGGTGSGLFLDIAAMVQTELQNVNIKAFLVLPDCFKHVGIDPKMSANGAAALREINHFQNHPYPLPWNQDQVVDNLFNQVFLFGGTNADGRNISTPNDAYRLIGEALFMRHSLGVLPGFIHSVSYNRAPYLQNTTSQIKDEQIVHSWQQAFSSFGVAKLVFPSWRLMHYAQFDLALQVTEHLFPEQPYDKTQIKIWRDQFLCKAGILHGTVESDNEEFNSGKHWLVRDALMSLHGEIPNIHTGIKALVDKLIQRAPEIFEEQKTEFQIRHIEQEIAERFGSPGDVNNEGEWTKQIRKNAKTLQEELPKVLGETIEWFYQKHGFANISFVIEETINLLQKSSSIENGYIDEMEQITLNQEALSQKIKEDYDRSILIAVDSEKGVLGTKLCRDPEVHLAALERFGEYFYRYWSSRFKSIVARECASVFRSALTTLKDKLHEFRELKDIITSHQMDWSQWKDHYARPVEGIGHQELEAPPLDTLLDPFIGSGPQRDEVLNRLAQRFMQTTEIHSCADLIQRLSDRSFKEKLIPFLHSSLRGEAISDGSHYYTKAFSDSEACLDEDYLGRLGFIEEWSIENLLQNNNIMPNISKGAAKLFEEGRSWIKKVSGEKAPGALSYTSYSDIFILVPGKVTAGERAFSKLEDTLRSVGITKGLNVNFCRDGDPSEIVLYTEEHAFPVFHHTAWHSQNGYLHHYKNLLGRVLVHTVKDGHLLDPILPEEE